MPAPTTLQPLKVATHLFQAMAALALIRFLFSLLAFKLRISIDVLGVFVAWGLQKGSYRAWWWGAVLAIVQVVRDGLDLGVEPGFWSSFALVLHLSALVFLFLGRDELDEPQPAGAS